MYIYIYIICIHIMNFIQEFDPVSHPRAELLHWSQAQQHQPLAQARSGHLADRDHCHASLDVGFHLPRLSLSANKSQTPGFLLFKSARFSSTLDRLFGPGFVLLAPAIAIVDGGKARQCSSPKRWELNQGGTVSMRKLRASNPTGSLWGMHLAKIAMQLWLYAGFLK